MIQKKKNLFAFVCNNYNYYKVFLGPSAQSLILLIRLFGHEYVHYEVRFIFRMTGESGTKCVCVCECIRERKMQIFDTCVRYELYELRSERQFEISLADHDYNPMYFCRNRKHQSRKPIRKPIAINFFESVSVRKGYNSKTKKKIINHKYYVYRGELRAYIHKWIDICISRFNYIMRF